jgi:hypothetical protein
MAGTTPKVSDPACGVMRMTSRANISIMKAAVSRFQIVQRLRFTDGPERGCHRGRLALVRTEASASGRQGIGQPVKAKCKPAPPPGSTV